MLKTILKSHLLRWIAAGLVVVLMLGYVGVGVYGASTFNVNNNRPADYGENTPAKYGLTYENISFPTAGTPQLTLQGWWIPNPKSDLALVIVHGHDANRTRHLPMSKPLWDQGFNLLYFDLQGQGTSQGDRYYFGQREQYDVVAAFNFVKSKGFTPSRIGVLAFSMGASSTLLALSHESDMRVVVSDSAYANFEKVADYRFTRTTGLPKFFLPGILLSARVMYGFDTNQTRPEETLPTVKDRRIFLIHGTADTSVPFEHFGLIKDAAGSNIVDSWVIEGADHIKGYDLYPDLYIQRVTTFFKQELAA